MRTLPVLAVIAVSAAVVGGVVAVLWSLGSSASAREPFSTLRMVPADVDLYIALNTEPASEQWIAVADLLDAVDAEDPLRNAWTELLAEEDLDWDEDIVSVLGDEGYIGITDFSTLDDYRGAVAAFELRDVDAAEALFLDKAAEEIDGEIETAAYDGVTIHLFPYDEPALSLDAGSGSFDETEPDLRYAAAAFTDGALILGLSQADIEQVIDVMRGREPGVTNDARFTELQQKQTDDFLIWGFVDMGAAWQAIDGFLEEGDSEATFGDEFSLEQYIAEARASMDRITFSVSARHDGFIIDAAMLRAPGAEAEAGYGWTEPFVSHWAEEVPEDALLFAAGYNPYEQVYRPAWDALHTLDLSFTDPYCGAFGFVPFPIGEYREYSEQDDPIYGQFFDEEGNFDDAAFLAWSEEIDRRFTLPDGSYDYEGYSEYLDSLYEEACDEKERTLDSVVAEWEQEVGFDLEQDLLALLTGEFAFALGASNFDADEPDFELAAMFDVTDAARVDESLRAVAEWLSREGELVIDNTSDPRLLELDDDGEYAAAWTARAPQGSEQFGRLVLGYPEAYVAAISGGSQDAPLTENGDWKSTMALLPAETTAILYVNMSRLIDEVGRIEDAAQEFEDATDGEMQLEDLEPIRSVAVATHNIEGGQAMRALVFIDD